MVGTGKVRHLTISESIACSSGSTVFESFVSTPSSTSTNMFGGTSNLGTIENLATFSDI
jgi:hypothetical protein